MLQLTDVRSPAPDATELAWGLIYDVTGDRGLADDWCDDLGAVVLARRPRAVGDAEVLRWLHATPSSPVLG